MLFVLQALVADIKSSQDAKDQLLEELRAKVNNNRKLSKEEEHAIQGKHNTWYHSNLIITEQ